MSKLRTMGSLNGEFSGVRDGFTLIELSIVLVIIGLIVGSVLVGQDLIRAAAVRAQITQIEKYNTAANAFYEKYGYLPGDIPAGPAAQFGFAPRGALAGEGDGNGILQGINIGTGIASGTIQSSGETGMFWVDLSAAGLIEGTFNTATSNSVPPSNPTGTALNNWLPPAKLGQGNYIYVYSFNGNNSYPPQGTNYFGLSAVTTLVNNSSLISTPTLTVQQAYAIDQKIDDGLPQRGVVLANYIASNGANIQWAAGGGAFGQNGAAATPGSSTTCFDNGSVSGATQKYSVEINNGANANCALSFQLKAGD